MKRENKEKGFSLVELLKGVNIAINIFAITIILSPINQYFNPESKHLLKLFLKVLKSLDGTDGHPSTFAHEIMGRMLSGELTRIS